jgi:alpha-ketoglutarate-dependent taurine dioxygenase
MPQTGGGEDKTMPAKLNCLPLTSSIGAVIEGLDIGDPMTPEITGFVRQCLLDHGVIFLRGQQAPLETFWDFLTHFGIPLKDETTGTPQDTADMVATNDMSPVRHTTATWHADTTSLTNPPWATALRAIQPPAFGGDTCWASMTAAFEALSEPMQRMLDGLTAVHSIQVTYDRMLDYAPHFEAQYAPRHAAEQVHPVVITHPETGRKALYVSECFTTRIVELSQAESAAVLGVLFNHVQRPDFTMRWKWSANDLAFWDNRAVLHYAVPDYQSGRVMQRIVLQGNRPGTAEFAAGVPRLAQ